MAADDRQGEPWLRAVVDRFEGPLVRYALRLTGDLEAARDVAQDTLLQLCRARPADVENRLAQWLFTVCRNRAWEIRRKETRMKPLSDSQAGACASREPAQTAVLETRELTTQVERLLESLPENQQEVVRLKFQNSLSYREIAEVTGLSVSNVGYLIHTAIQTLRREMNGGET